MGYTNTWTPNKPRLDQMKEFDPDMLDEIRNVVKTYNERAAKKTTDTIHKPVKAEISSDTIRIKGTAESFDFNLWYCDGTRDGVPAIYERLGIDSWKFCKTYGDPYDAVVKCILMCLTYHGLLLSWGHDGDGNCTEHRKAIALAKRCDIPIVHGFHPATNRAY